MVLYREIFTERTYERHGIALHEGATVFDVGANIGLFSLHLSRTVTGIRLHAFEPVPDIYEALNRNLAEHAPQARSYNLGLAEKSGEAIFELDRFSTIASTMHPRVFDEGSDKQASATKWADAALADFDKIDPGKPWVRLARRGLEMRGVRMLILLGLAGGYLALRLRRSLFLRHQRCKLQTPCRRAWLRQVSIRWTWSKSTSKDLKSRYSPEYRIPIGTASINLSSRSTMSTDVSIA